MSKGPGKTQRAIAEVFRNAEPGETFNLYELAERIIGDEAFHTFKNTSIYTGNGFAREYKYLHRGPYNNLLRAGRKVCEREGWRWVPGSNQWSFGYFYRMNPR